MYKDITYQEFESILGETVELKSEHGSFSASVEKVSLLRQQPGQERQPYSVDLLADAEDDFGQQIYVLSHPRLGETSLFAVPLGPDKDGMRYQVVFN